MKSSLESKIKMDWNAVVSGMRFLKTEKKTLDQEKYRQRI